MLVNASNLAAIQLNIKTTFNKAFQTTESTWSKVAMLVPSTGALNDYDWLENFPAMKEWIGDKEIKNFVGNNYVVANKDFEVTVAIKRKNIEDDNVGLYANWAEGAGWSAKQHPDELVYGAVNNAFIGKCYDGQPFYGNHKVGKLTVSNKLTIAFSVASSKQAKACFGAARIMLEKMKDQDGRPLRCKATTLLVGPDLRDDAEYLRDAEFLRNGDANPYRGAFELVVEPLITSSTFWAVLDTSKPVKPFIYQQRKAAVIVAQTDPQSDSVFTRGEFLMGAESRGNAAYGFWQLSVGSNGTTANNP